MPSRQKVICEVVDIRNPPASRDDELTRPSESRKTTSPTILRSLEPRSASPAPSVVSVTPSVREEASITIDGRVFSANGFYPLPFNLDTKQDCAHQCTRICLRGKLCPEPARMDEVLRDDGTGQQKAILDLGCGNGNWALEMATQYPHCNVVGVDLVPLPEADKAQFPPNFRMEMDDVNLGLGHFYGQFDVVNVRAIASGIKDYPQLIDEVWQILRPGGLIILGEYVYQSVHSNGKLAEKLPVWHPQHSWFPLFTEAMANAVLKAGGDPYVGSQLLSYVEEQGAFEDIGSCDFILPVHPWFPSPVNEDQILANIIGTLMSTRLEEFATPRLLEASGLNGPMSAELCRGLKMEIHRGVYRSKIGSRFVFVWARKPSGEL